LPAAPAARAWTRTPAISPVSTDERDASCALYTNATLALDPRTGRIKWHFQYVPGESHDMDEAFEQVLIDSDGKSSLFTMGKLGILWELNRKDRACGRWHIIRTQRLYMWRSV
jgi:glucose dehydrogenase